MKVYLFISKEKKLLKMYEPYTEAMSQKLDITDKLTDADVVLILGAWTMQGAQLARKSRKMGIPYIVCPLGDVSERNCKNPWLKRSLQTACYQKSMYSKADLLIAHYPIRKGLPGKVGMEPARFPYPLLRLQSTYFCSFDDGRLGRGRHAYL